MSLLLLRGIYSPRERVDGLDSQGQLFCKEGSGLFCLHNLEMVEQQTFICFIISIHGLHLLQKNAMSCP